ncbi:hypothetical protein [Campylobacter sp. RM16187]|nr:hypothetical protein [Campylobacter sp. RM16187]
MTKEIFNLILSIVFIVIAVLAFNYFFKLPGQIDMDFVQEQRLNNGK